jgi:hypothetical protein
MNGLTEMANLADQHFYELTNNPDLTPEQAENQANNLNSLEQSIVSGLADALQFTGPCDLIVEATQEPTQKPQQ